jgi:5-methylcytosine-specific restriction endonuclease McrA
METTCIILNADYTFLNIVNWKKAIILLVKGKTEVLKYSEKIVKNYDGDHHITIPIVMKLIKIVRVIYRNKVPFNKNNVITRDRNICQYCGRKSKKLTIDHVIPVSRGGKSCFENCVAACPQCNAKKGNRLPSESGMFLIKLPSHPTISEFIRIKMETLGLSEMLKELFAEVAQR